MPSLRHALALLLPVAVVALSAGFVGGLLAPAPAQGHAVAKGIIDHLLEHEPVDSTARAAMVREIDRGLGARWVRVSVDWGALEPVRDEYSPTELARLDTLVRDLHAAGVKVMLTTGGMPAWASRSYWWSRPPAGHAAGPQGFYPIRSDRLRDYGDLAEFLARRYRGKIQALENWNEPNLWTFIYPQRTADDPYFAARIYVRMLKAFRAGVRRAGTGVRVVAGATAPIGLNDRYRTSPQRFARFLKRARASRYFDVYSHHPYTPGGSLYAAPDRPPNDPSTTVTLYNLKTLLRLFPKKPFYVTEYGYSTRPSPAFGGFAVSEAAQARYLRSAFNYAGRYRQVKLLFWFTLRDTPPGSGDPALDVYSGLRRPNGERKPAWYAFRRL